MKVGDIVTLRDGSYNMILNGGVLEHITRIVHEKRRYQVLGLSGAYPTDNSHSPSGYAESNDTMLVDGNDCDFVLFTQERFCKVVTPAPVKFPPDQIEIVVARGTKEVRLVLQ